MSIATAASGPAAGHPRPRLVVIHGDALEQPRAAVAGTGPIGVQQELPLAWPLDPGGEAASSILARYPPLPLDPGVPRPEPYVAQLARLLADVLAGARPVSQLARHAMLDVQQELTRRSALRRGGRNGSGVPAKVTSTSTMVVSGTAVQVTVVFFAGPRAHAAAVRMEYRHQRWMVTDVQSPA